MSLPNDRLSIASSYIQNDEDVRLDDVAGEQRRGVGDERPSRTCPADAQLARVLVVRGKVDPELAPDAVHLGRPARGAHIKLIYPRHARATPPRPPPSAPQALMLFTKHENKFSVLLIIRRGARYMCSGGMKEPALRQAAGATSPTFPKGG